MRPSFQCLDALSDEDVLRTSEAALILGLSVTRVRILLRKQRIKFTYSELHRSYEVKVSDLREFILNRHTVKLGRPRREDRLP
jgi:hypothetical protein